MRTYVAAFLTAVMLVTGLPLQAAGGVQVSWQALAPLVEGKKISLVLPDSAHLRGTVVAVEKDQVILDIGKTSDPQAHPKGRATIPRTSFRSFEMTKTRTLWKVLGTTIGLGTGLAIAVPVNAYAHNEGDGAPLAIAAIIAVPTAVGFLVGWASDKKTVTVTVTD